QPRTICARLAPVNLPSSNATSLGALSGFEASSANAPLSPSTSRTRRGDTIRSSPETAAPATVPVQASKMALMELSELISQRLSGGAIEGVVPRQYTIGLIAAFEKQDDDLGRALPVRRRFRGDRHTVGL